MPLEKAYVILAHKNPDQTTRLINALDDGHSKFFLHVDEKSYSPEWRKLGQETCGVTAIDPVATPWGGIGLVDATLKGLKAVRQDKKQFDFVSLISGQHYPVKSAGYVDDFLQNSPSKTFLEFTSLPDHNRWSGKKGRGGLYRIDKYYLGLSTAERYAAKTLNFISAKTGLLERKFPQDMKPYAGSQWFTTDNHGLNYTLDYVAKNPQYRAYHRYGFAPDELFFHNILLNAEDEKVRSGITNDNLLYMNWPDSNAAHPKLLTMDDSKDILNTRALFARKFDMLQDARILNFIDEKIIGKKFGGPQASP